MFDFHFHPSLRYNLLKRRKQKKLGLWKNVEIRLGIDDLLNGDRLDSQSSFSQLDEGGVEAGIVTFLSLERAMADRDLFKAIVWVASKLDIDKLKSITEKKVSYYDALINEMNNYFDSLNSYRETIENVRNYNSSEDFDDEKINVLYSVEGAHCFMTMADEDMNGSELLKDEASMNAIANRIPEFKNKLSSKGGKLLYLTLTHIQSTAVATHSFAYISYAGKEHKNDIIPFLPTSYNNQPGITELGEKLIHKAWENDILIDIKHLSYPSRIKYYKMVEEEKQKGNKIPIIGSHMGVTGVSFDTYSKSLSNATPFNKGQDEFFSLKVRKNENEYGVELNPLSINLFDEEIKYIVESGGLIGISLDQRIIGDTVAKKNVDYFSGVDYNYLINDYVSDSSFLDKTPIEQAENTFDLHDFLRENPHLRKKYEHLFMFTSQILQIVKAGGKDAWDCICIGSDFDGLVDAVDFCHDTSEFEELASQLAQCLSFIFTKTTDFEKVYHINRDEVFEKVEKIVRTNGLDFIKKIKG